MTLKTAVETYGSRSCFDRAPLSVAEGLRANGILECSTAVFSIKGTQFLPGIKKAGITQPFPVY